VDEVGVIDRFLDVFSRYIDSGFGLLGSEVRFLSATLIAIDVTLAGLFWAMGHASGQGDEVMARLIRKVLYVGTFAYILGHFNQLAGIVFRSFAGLGLLASGSGMTHAQFLRPGQLAKVGIDAGQPIMEQIGSLMGFPEVFANLDTVAVLFLAWLVLILSFFILAVQLFVTLIEFKLTTLAGFVLVPFAFWNGTAFLAEKVLGNVVSSGIKVLVLAVIVGIGSGLFAEFKTPPDAEPSIDHALVIMLASLAMLGLGIFGPGIATGLVAGGPQLGAGAAAGTALGMASVAMAGGAAMTGAGSAVAAGARLAPGALRAATGAGRMATASAVNPLAASGVHAARQGGAVASVGTAWSAMAGGVAKVTKQEAGTADLQSPISAGSSVAAPAGAAMPGATREAAGLGSNDVASQTHPPVWAHRMRQRQAMQAAALAAQVLRSGDHPSGSTGPRLGDDAKA
jgi:type IV secretion system protein TrbL